MFDGVWVGEGEETARSYLFSVGLAGIPLIQLDREGRVLMVSSPVGNDRAVLRRAQAWAATNPTGLTVVAGLLDKKLEGQSRIATGLGGDSARIDEARGELEHANSLDELMWLEASAANHYWHAWEAVECRFIRKDQERVPDHWRTFGVRGSGFNASGPRGAANPINALLNYLYALLEVETTIGCQTVGLDPGVGILHADQRNRDSMALDIMEAARPAVDEKVLRILAKQRFKASAFVESRRGICRLSPTTAHWLAESCSELAGAVAPHIESVAHALASTPDVKVDRIPTPLTGSNRSRGRPPKRKPANSDSQAPSHCHTCGGKAPKKRTQCDECLPVVRAEALDRLISSAHEELQRRRAAGDDPSQTDDAQEKRGKSNHRHQLEVHEWNRSNTNLPDAVFIQTILPGLQDVPLNEMARATGLTPGYCSYIRRGLRVPHQRHWSTLAALVQTHGVR